MNKKALIGIGIGAVAVGIFLLAVTNPNLRENKDTYFGFIETTQEPNADLELYVERFNKINDQCITLRIMNCHDEKIVPEVGRLVLEDEYVNACKKVRGVLDETYEKEGNLPVEEMSMEYKELASNWIISGCQIAQFKFQAWGNPYD